MRRGFEFVFANKRPTRLKVLWFERNGFCLLYKRLHQAVFDHGAGSVTATNVAPRPHRWVPCSAYRTSQAWGSPR
jgi:hypothetical protein